MGTVALAHLFAKKFYPESPWMRIGILLAMVMLMIGAQIYIFWPVFVSQYNWFHMIRP